jgi:pantoate--beta-alanine ligase
VREADGLAMSSRNILLTAEDRRAAPVLHRALSAAQSAYANGEKDANKLRAIMSDILAKEPRATVEYASVADPVTLAELDTVGAKGALVSMAVRFGPVRLIDNVVLG